MSPFVPKQLPPIESFEADMHRLSEAFHARQIRLLGGEPLQNPQIVDYIRIAKASGIADKVTVITNGILLPRTGDDFWQNVDLVRVGLYPGARRTEKVVQDAEATARATNTQFIVDRRMTFRTTIVTSPHPKDRTTDMIFRTCRNAHKHHCHMVYEGRFFKCACPAFLPDYLAQINGAAGTYDPSADAFLIHEAKDLLEELKTFLFANKTLDACRFCLGHVGKRIQQGQIPREVVENPLLEPVRRDTHLSKGLLGREWARYYGRRVLEAVTRRPVW